MLPNNLLLVSLAAMISNLFLILLMYQRRLATLRRRRLMIVSILWSSWRARRRQLTSRHRFLRHRIYRLSEHYSPRHWWSYPRPSVWWQRFVTEIWGDEQWVENFRLTREKFMWICERIRGRLMRQTTALRETISPEERVAVAIWFLANTVNYRLVGQQFGLARSTVAGIVIEVCLAMELELLHIVVRPGPPTEAMSGFSNLGFPHCVGAMDGCHIYVHAPIEEQEAYIDRHHRASVVLQAIVDHMGHFTDISIGNVGQDHDAHILRCSNVFDSMDAGTWVPNNPTLSIHGVNIPPLIIADAAYPLRSWLITPYSGGNLDPPKRHFNRLHNRARCVVERAFGPLKGRWRCLGGTLSVREENFNCVISACITLHNISQSRTVQPEYSDLGVHHAPIPRHRGNPQTVDENQQKEGEKVRRALTEWLFQQRTG